MARRNRVETCMICDSAPCECNAVAPKRTVRKTAAAQVTAGVEAQPGQSGQERPVPSRRLATESDLVFVSALRALAPILHENELVKYAALLAMPETLDEKAAAWRLRRRDGAA